MGGLMNTHTHIWQEQQCVSLAKAGVVCSLPARASILAAANPTGGHYNKAKTVSENLKFVITIFKIFDGLCLFF